MKILISRFFIPIGRAYRRTYPRVGMEVVAGSHVVLDFSLDTGRNTFIYSTEVKFENLRGAVGEFRKRYKVIYTMQEMTGVVKVEIFLREKELTGDH